MKHLNITISGRVQGVGFRFSAMEVAYRYGINGFVLNRPNGVVYIEAEGEEQALEQFLSWCRKGPIGAHVSEVTAVDGKVVGFAGFDIRRAS